MLVENLEGEFQGSDIQGLSANLLEAARRRNLSANSLAAYERTWTRFLAWAAASNFDPRSLPFPTTALEAYRFLGEGKNAASRDGAPFSNKAFNARLKLACQCARVPVIPTRFSIYQLRAVPFEAHTFLATDPK